MPKNLSHQPPKHSTTRTAQLHKSPTTQSKLFNYTSDLLPLILSHPLTKPSQNIYMRVFALLHRPSSIPWLNKIKCPSPVPLRGRYITSTTVPTGISAISMQPSSKPSQLILNAILYGQKILTAAYRSPPGTGTQNLTSFLSPSNNSKIQKEKL